MHDGYYKKKRKTEVLIYQILKLGSGVRAGWGVGVVTKEYPRSLYIISSNNI
jgi:hypothetical protein